ncbi:hypothetical protein HK097_004549 [Rhizophlyctis rosea]|uniref:Uncharacterized protein n=1 Tax=Rhizophlyctis rosea TaxID=64517 RepID=A0AAD5SDZ2_9FUNG|nr:hypothetical protein HK097_004549 [Rhizophlyctis rosea]
MSGRNYLPFNKLDHILDRGIIPNKSAQTGYFVFSFSAPVQLNSVIDNPWSTNSKDQKTVGVNYLRSFDTLFGILERAKYEIHLAAMKLGEKMKDGDIMNNIRDNDNITIAQLEQVLSRFDDYLDEEAKGWVKHCIVYKQMRLGIMPIPGYVPRVQSNRRIKEAASDSDSDSESEAIRKREKAAKKQREKERKQREKEERKEREKEIEKVERAERKEKKEKEINEKREKELEKQQKQQRTVFVPQPLPSLPSPVASDPPASFDLTLGTAPTSAPTSNDLSDIETDDEVNSSTNRKRKLSASSNSVHSDSESEKEVELKKKRKTSPTLSKSKRAVQFCDCGNKPDHKSKKHGSCAYNKKNQQLKSSENATDEDSAAVSDVETQNE